MEDTEGSFMAIQILSKKWFWIKNFGGEELRMMQQSMKA